ncbi:MAG TPA: hypothetical protein VG710_12790, partial [Opitutus sp.]|nr:hypothetical protein [Opitutus sp.]
VRDQFMLGGEMLVAPVLAQGAVERAVVFPPGTWHGDDDAIVTGPAQKTVAAPLHRLPHFRLVRKPD